MTNLAKVVQKLGNLIQRVCQPSYKMHLKRCQSKVFIHAFTSMCRESAHSRMRDQILKSFHRLKQLDTPLTRVLSIYESMSQRVSAVN